jgi:uncharacterized membrane protein
MRPPRLSSVSLSTRALGSSIRIDSRSRNSLRLPAFFSPESRVSLINGGKLISAVQNPRDPFTAAELGMLAHLYRGEMYRSKIWRTRLDATTNWAVATTGIALSVSFSSAGNSPLPLVLVALMSLVFLVIEARRYRYFDIWRTRVRVLETCMYAPILRGEGVRIDNGWNHDLARDYEHLHFHIGYLEALGRRLRRNYSFMFGVQAVSYVTKICVHPMPIKSLEDLWQHATIGPIPGQAVLIFGFMFHAGLVALAVLTLKGQRAVGRVKGPAQRNKADS